MASVPEPNPLRWGFCSAGKVANDFSVAMDSISDKGEHRKVAVAARDATKAEEFSQKHKFEKFYGGYEELAKDEDVEIVYVSSLHPQHYELTKMFLMNDKHVLCEKPMTMELEHTAELVKLAKKRGLFLMEAFWSRFFPVYQNVKESINAGLIGDVNYIDAHFHYGTPSERQLVGQLGGSAWFDIGVYCLNLADFIFDSAPIKIESLGSYIDESKVDNTVLVSLEYPNGKFASLSAVFMSLRPSTAVISGSKGYIEIKPPFHASTQYELFKEGNSGPTLFSFPFENKTEGDSEKYVYPHSEGFVYEMEHVRKCLRDNQSTESDIMSLETSLRMAQATKLVLEQI